MKHIVVLSLSTLLFFSCAEELIEKPDNLIPQDKMVLIIKEMAIINAAKGTNIGQLKDNGIEPTEFLFEKFKIDSAQYVDSDRYYASKPLLYETMYKDVEARLEKQRLKLEADKKINDSLNLVKKDAKKDLKQIEKTADKTKSVPQ
ncbi:DUF4296 domain-containing protein [Maribacter hydrothermalis]|uniref:DUF4296 domain-containing protein n=1 Tax=Maribacter hydrothermalis TaxID=1836467 RepID=A0A1B7Z3H4_9FLAO|nr:DUF4296 domain-containing protein [Maribacter hydrothermalis]APQ17008.1 hypothetical protein BTR34_06585 [Maribacter hydrothermalis]OBR37269.1 hypothetical protein A9200_06345 [Maribacter hydrothermalis]